MALVLAEGDIIRIPVDAVSQQFSSPVARLSRGFAAKRALQPPQRTAG
jgi:hypothetical protein